MGRCLKPYRPGGILELGCGQCMPCRISKAREWQHRMILEAYSHEESCFITLTYDEEHLPENGSLNPDDVKAWLKRFRRRLEPRKVRYFLVGEYGDETKRPHYHVVMYGFDCADPGGRVHRRRVEGSNAKCKCRNCELVRATWDAGRIDVGVFNNHSASYCAGYITKKLNGKGDKDKKWCEERLGDRYPEFSRMSRRPGIGAKSMEKLKSSLTKNYGRFLLEKNGDVPYGLRHGKTNLPPGS